MKVAIFGPGAVGGYLGLCLSAGGLDVRLVGRPEADSDRPPLSFAATARGKIVQPRHALPIERTLDAARDCEVAVVAVKSSETARVAAAIGPVLPSNALVVSFQNGLTNSHRLRDTLTQRVGAGIVAFNVVSTSDQRVQTTRGKLFVEEVEHPGARALVAGFIRAGQSALLSSDIRPLMAGKLLLNLHNGVSAATGLMTWDTLLCDPTRRCYAACFREGIRVLRSSGWHPQSALPLPLQLVAWGLSLPSSLIRPFARAAMSEGSGTTSSTLTDVRAGRKTEIDEFNGAIVRLAREQNESAPANRAVCEAVHELETRRPPRFLSGEELERRIQAAYRSLGSATSRREGTSFFSA